LVACGRRKNLLFFVSGWDGERAAVAEHRAVMSHLVAASGYAEAEHRRLKTKPQQADSARIRATGELGFYGRLGRPRLSSMLIATHARHS
jgi:hypothetical protein